MDPVRPQATDPGGVEQKKAHHAEAYFLVGLFFLSDLRLHTRQTIRVNPGKSVLSVFYYRSRIRRFFRAKYATSDMPRFLIVDIVKEHNVADGCGGYMVLF